MEILKMALVAILAVWLWNKLVTYAQLPAELEA